ncbi:hypothetical protein CMQ_3807 [Grosmannia clavigera kw1407]|uniref:Protein BIG1 n=1 Tax=Grosmannia clavigera (strain kw1407 / UAMH 11150) TaxID=655863 RepID=F0XA94_GROCL|nr:uncharacterized protein CMQ_3807 [Grosmannia clavigera kw1407]EFX05738.1 hypothetical protein CMQ_3807 [Grosmannia clavigera kw1407]
MRSSIFASLLAAGSAHAFSDSSPFLLFSTAKFPSAHQPSQLQTSSSVLSAAKDILSLCPTTNYLLVSQANAHASDLDGPEECGVHRIRSAVTSDAVQGRYTVAEVVNAAVGNMSFDSFSDHIKKSCLGKGAREAIIRQLSLTPLPTSRRCKDRVETMDDNDYALGNILQEKLPSGDYTVLFFSTPHESRPYEVDFENPSQIQLSKRIAEPARAVHRRAAADANWPKDAALFDKYQFFTPGIFMGLSTFFVLLSILYVGLAALSSLEVSYGAFDKDISPTAQKKQN